MVWVLSLQFKAGIFQLAGFGGQSSVVVTVYVKDSNDHSPVWSAKWARQGPVPVSGDAPVGSVILKVGLCFMFYSYSWFF